MVEELIKLTQPVVAEVRAPISVEQAGVTVGETFHQSVYLALNLTPELRTIRANLLKAVGAPADLESPAFPHASLYYGDGSSEDKHRVVVQMMDAGTLDILGNGSIEVTRLGPRFELTEVWIVDIVSQQPASWKVLHKQALAGGELAPSLTPSPPPSSPVFPVSPLTPLRQSTAGTTSSTSGSPTTMTTAVRPRYEEPTLSHSHATMG